MFPEHILLSIKDVKKILKFLEKDIDIEKILIQPYATSIFFYNTYGEFIFEWYNDCGYQYIRLDKDRPCEKIPISKILKD